MTAEIVVLTKPPVPGRVKTRLAADIGTDAATALHEAMLWETLERARATRFPVRVSLDGPTDTPFSNQLRHSGFQVEQQAGGDLGSRMRHALRHPGRQFALGSDCVVFDPDWLRDAAFANEAVALGRTDDGGYWTIGGNLAEEQLAACLFDEMPWSTPSVADITLERLRSKGTRTHILPNCYDVDTCDDLKRLTRDRRCVGRVRAVLNGISGLTQL